MLHLAMWVALDQLKGPKNKGGLRFRQLDTKKMKIVNRKRVLIYKT